MKKHEFLNNLLEKKLFLSDNSKVLYSYSGVELWEKIAESYGLFIDRDEIEKHPESYSFNLIQDKNAYFKTEILKADEYRAGIEPYDAKCLEDVNLGHWELWQDESEDGIPVVLEEPLVARNPAADIREDGIVGIDFGTKSTIVSYQDGDDNTKLLRVGMGQLSKKAELFHYENPTVMEFLNIDSFLSAYNSMPGRPHTSRENLTVSHSAENNFKNSEDSSIFYSFFYDIKQWCGDSSRYKQVKIIDQANKERVLPPYLEIEDGDFDPVEIYAYYLGLFINNMRNGIYLDYVLSFPVAYSKAVRERLLKSFTAGLKKSLPTSILNNAEVMRRFKVKQGVSEPAAYAICALKQYGFDPKEGEKIFYGIFDFGGGTTDFDFGIWRSAEDTREERKYDYVIDHFGSDGDRYLGGENLLELLAFEVFKANKDKLLKSKEVPVGFSFFKPAECSDFPGSEVLISSSQEAKRNTKKLMEVLRPFWEGLQDAKNDEYIEVGLELVASLKAAIEVFGGEPAARDNKDVLDKKIEDYSAKYKVSTNCTILDAGFIDIELFNKNGETETVRLDIDNKDGIKVDLFKILEDRIDAGVKNFFEALKLTFKKNRDNIDSDKIHVFLAGNSSKSPILRNCFERHIKEIDSNMNLSDVQHFELFPPLGTDEAIKIQRDRGVVVDENDILRPTGKTGVAYGLIEGRAGGTIKVISEITATDEIKFKYYIGRGRKGTFRLVSDRNIPYNQWIEFTDAVDESFELYYSTLPEVTTQDTKLTSSGIHKKRLMIDNVSENGNVYIRTVEPTVIEFAAAEDEESLQNEDYISEPKRVDLSQ
ncbi:MAG: hypothetical protein NC401_11435 [Ruminococcus sp.]|nr:hypothetical protein [Ruminococcus sp.]